jgi:hypothetical protein
MALRSLTRSIFAPRTDLVVTGVLGDHPALCDCGSRLRPARCCALDPALLPPPGAGAPLLPLVERAAHF